MKNTFKYSKFYILVLFLLLAQGAMQKARAIVLSAPDHYNYSDQTDSDPEYNQTQTILLEVVGDQAGQSGGVYITTSLGAPVTTLTLIYDSGVNKYWCTWQPTGVAEGYYNIKFQFPLMGADQIDLGENLFIDNTTPQISITTPTAGSSGNGFVQWTLNENSTAGISAGYILWQWAGGTADPTSPHQQPLNSGTLSGTYTYTQTGLVSGATYNISAQVVDWAKNLGQISVATVTIDTTGPVFTVTSPVNSAYISSSKVIYSLSETAVMHADSYIRWTCTNGLDLGSPRTYLLQASDITAGSHTLNTTVTGLVNYAQYNIEFKARDAVGNVGTASTVTGVVYDSTAPSATVTQPTSGSSVMTSQVMYTLNKNLQSGIITWQYTGGQPGTSRSYTMQAADLTMGAHTIPNSAVLSNGAVYTVTMTAQDGSGTQISPPVSIVNVTYDTTPATITLSSPTTGATIAAAKVSYTLSKNFSKGSVEVSWVGGNADPNPHVYTLQAGELTSGTHTNVTLTGVTLVQGAIYSFTIRGSAGGTQAPAMAATNVTYNSTPPVFTVTIPTSGTYIKSSRVKYTLNTSFDTGTITFTRIGGTADAASPHTHTMDAIERSAGDHDVTLADVVLVNNAIYQVVFAGSNGVGTASPVTRTNVTYDNLAPTASITAPITGTAFSQIKVSYELSEAFSAGSLEFSLYSGTDANAPHVAIFDGAQRSAGIHTDTDFSSITLADGARYTITLRGSDQAGNDLTPVSVANVLYDQVPPQITLNAPSGDNKWIGSAKISYSLTKALVEGSVEWAWYSGTADSAAPHYYPLTATDLTSGNHYNVNTGASLVEGATYILRVSGKDVNNTWASAQRSYISYDATTPVIADLKPLSNSNVKTKAISYHLSEQFGEGTLEWTRTGGADDPDSPHVVSLITSELAEGTHENIIPANSPNLKDGSRYSLKISGRDRAGNTANSITNTEILYDNEKPVFTNVAPLTDSFVNSAKVSYTLNEDIKEGTIEWTRTGGSPDAGSPHVCKLTGGELTAGAHTAVTLSNAPQVTNGAIYTVTFKASDFCLNASDTITSTNVTVDTDPPVFTDTAPVENAYIKDAKVSFTLNEQLSWGIITFERTGGTADAGSPHVQNLVGSELAAGAHTNITLTNSPTLSAEAIYTVKFEGEDRAGNAATAVVATNVNFDNKGPVISVSKPANDTSGNSARVTYTLDEILSEGTITWINVGTIVIDANTPKIATLDGTELASGPHINITLAHTPTLVDGATYNVVFAGKDRAGNSATPITITNWKYDVTPPGYTVYFPESNKHVKTANVSYYLTENLSAGSIIWTRVGGTADAGSPHNQPLDATEMLAGLHFDHALTAEPTLVHGAIYNIAFYATDLAGNSPALPTTIENVTYDIVAPTITGVRPLSNYYVNSPRLSYVLNEDFSSMKTTWTRIGGSADPSSPRVISMFGSELSAGSHFNILPVFAPPSLQDGSIYRVVFTGADLAGNEAVSVTSDNVTYDITPPAFTGARVVANAASYKNNDEIVLTCTVSEPEVDCTADFSAIDSQYVINAENSGTTGLVSPYTCQVKYDLTNINTREDGIYSINVRATDRAGNTTDYQIDLELDNNSPIHKWTIPTSGDNIYKNGDVIALSTTWDASDYVVSADFSNVDNVGYTTRIPSTGPTGDQGFHKYTLNSYTINAGNGVNTGAESTVEVIIYAKDTSNGSENSYNYGVWLDNKQPSILFPTWYKVKKDGQYINSSTCLSTGDITVEVRFSETVDLNSAKLPEMRLREVSNTASSKTLLTPGSSAATRWDNTNKILSIPYTIASDSWSDDTTIGIVVYNYYDIAGNRTETCNAGTLPVTWDTVLFRFDDEEPSVLANTFSVYDQFGNELNSSVKPGLEWYLKYSSNDLSHSNAQQVSVTVDLTENFSFDTNSVTLYWMEEGSGHKASKKLNIVKTQTAVPSKFRGSASNFSLIQGEITTSDISEGDNIIFWVEGKDSAGNAFSIFNSSGNPAAIATVGHITTISAVTAEINPAYVIPEKASQTFYADLLLDLRYYDTGINKIIIDTPNSLNNPSGAYVTNITGLATTGLDAGVPLSGAPDYNDTKITYYLSNKIDYTTGITKIRVQFNLNTKTTSDLPGGEQYACKVSYHTNNNTLDIRDALAGDANGIANDNNLLVVYTQYIAKGIKAVISPQTVGYSRLNTYVYSLKNITIDSTCAGINRITITVPNSHEVQPVTSDIIVKDAFNIALPESTASGVKCYTSQVTAGPIYGNGLASWGGKIYVYIYGNTYQQLPEYRIQFKARSSATTDAPTGVKFTSQVDYVDNSISRTSPMDVPEEYTNATRVVTQPVVSGGTLAVDPLVAVPSSTSAFSANFAMTFLQGSSGIDKITLISGVDGDDESDAQSSVPLAVTAINYVKVGGVNVSYASSIQDGTLSVTLSSVVNTTTNVEVNFSATAPAAPVTSGLIALLENTSNSVTADCTGTNTMVIGYPVGQFVAPNTIYASFGVLVDDTLKQASSDLATNKLIKLVYALNLDLRQENTGVNKFTLTPPATFLNPSVKGVRVNGASLDTSKYSAIKVGADFQVQLTDTLNYGNFAWIPGTPGKGTVEVVIEGTTPSSVNQLMYFYATADNSKASAVRTMRNWDDLSSQYLAYDTLITKNTLFGAFAKITGRNITSVPCYVQKGTADVEYTASIKPSYLATEDTGFNTIKFELANHILFSVTGVSKDGVDDTAMWTSTIADPYTIRRTNDMIRDNDTIEVRFLATSPLGEDFPTGVDFKVKLDNAFIGKTVTATALKTNSLKLISTSAAETATLAVAPAQIAPNGTSIMTFTVSPSIDAAKNLGVDQVDISLSNFTVTNAVANLSAPTANVTVGGVVYPIDNSRPVPLPGKSYLSYAGGILSCRIGTLMQTSKAIVINAGITAPAIEQEMTITAGVKNTKIIRSAAVSGTYTVTTKMLPAVSGTIAGEIWRNNYIPGITTGTYEVMVGTSEIFAYYLKFDTSAQTSGVNKIVVDFPDDYSGISVSSFASSSNGAVNPAISYTTSVSSDNKLTITLISPISAAGTHHVTVDIACTTPPNPSTGVFKSYIDNLSSPNETDVPLGDVDGNGAYSYTISAQSNLKSASGHVSPNNVLINSKISFTVAVVPVFDGNDNGIDTIKIQVPASYTLTPATAVKYVFFGGKTDKDCDITVSSGNLITVKRKTEFGPMNSTTTSQNRRISVVFEAVAPAVSDAQSGGTQFKVYVDRNNSSNLQVSADAADAFKVTASYTTVDKVEALIRPGKNRSWDVMVNVDFSVGMNNEIMPEITLQPKYISQLSVPVSVISYYGDLFLGKAELSFEDEIMEKFGGTIEVWIKNSQDIYGNLIKEMTREVSIAPGFLITAFQNPLADNVIIATVKSSKTLVSGTPEITIVQSNVSRPVLSVSRIRGNLYSFIAPIEGGTSYSSIVKISASGTDTQGVTGNTDYNFTVGRLLAVKGGEFASHDGNMRLNIPAQAVADNATVTILPYYDNSSAQEAAAQGAISKIQAPAAETKGELTLLSEVYSPGPVSRGFRKDFSVNLAYEYDNSSGIKRNQIALFAWNGDKWEYVNSEPKTGVVSAYTRKMAPFAVFADTAVPQVSNLVPEDGNVCDLDSFRIEAEVSDNGSGVSAKGIVLKIDGQIADIDYDSKTGMFSYAPKSSLEPGEYALELEVSDNVGNMAPVFTRSFAVAGSLGLTRVETYPNPADIECAFSYTLSSASTERVYVVIYDVSGETVANLEGTVSLGRNTAGIIWDLTNNDGREVASGVYFYKLIAEQGGDKVTENGKIAVLR